MVNLEPVDSIVTDSGPDGSPYVCRGGGGATASVRDEIKSFAIELGVLRWSGRLSFLPLIPSFNCKALGVDDGNASTIVHCRKSSLSFIHTLKEEGMGTQRSRYW